MKILLIQIHSNFKNWRNKVQTSPITRDVLNLSLETLKNYLKWNETSSGIVKGAWLEFDKKNLVLLSIVNVVWRTAFLG